MIPEPTRPTTEQREAVARLRALWSAQIADLETIDRLWPALDDPECAAARARNEAGFAEGVAAWRAVHLAYGGLAPAGVTAPLVEDYYARLAGTPEEVVA